MSKPFLTHDFRGLTLACLRTARYAMFAMLLAWQAGLCQAQEIDPTGKWYSVNPADASQAQAQLTQDNLTPIAVPPLTGGRFQFHADFEVAADGDYVIDFKNSSTIAHFRHTLLDAQGQLVATAQGGIMDTTPNPYFLRHGRLFDLKAGHYQLVTELTSPYFIAPPQPYLVLASEYQQNIKAGNALTLLCLGIFIALGIYYAALAGIRMHMAEAMYAVFILGNLIFNSASLLVLSDLFGIHQFYLSSTPILISNLAYIVFVMQLLGIKPDHNRKLYYTGVTVLATMTLFIGIAYFNPTWSLELARYGVGLFLCYGLVSGITIGYQGNKLARFYVVAILAFFALGGLTITSHSLGQHTFYIEHLGLLSVATEAILLALVLSYQFAQLHREKEHVLFRLRKSEHIAMTDALTELPNRYALELEMLNLPTTGSLTFLDLDGLKYYNDQFGHERGDQLLQSFGRILRHKLLGLAILHRLGGDEFAITCNSGAQQLIFNLLEETVEALRDNGFIFAGFSAGSVLGNEASDVTSLMHLADTRMYANKRQRKDNATKVRLEAVRAGN